jgi:hypothetical protein
LKQVVDQPVDPLRRRLDAHAAFNAKVVGPSRRVDEHKAYRSDDGDQNGFEHDESFQCGRIGA